MDEKENKYTMERINKVKVGYWGEKINEIAVVVSLIKKIHEKEPITYVRPLITKPMTFKDKKTFWGNVEN